MPALIPTQEEIDMLVQAAKQKLSSLFTSVGMPESHGLGHCLIVLGNMEKAIASADERTKKLLSPQMIVSLKMAALLHEADDHKYFKTENFSNAKDILQEVLPEDANKTKIISDVAEMISYVSASVNGNTVPEVAKTNPTYLWPRFCDRLEAIGVIGAVRCYQYNRETSAPFSTESTPRPTNEKELWAMVTAERWLNYQQTGNSASMMDHFYDKLLHIAYFDQDVVQNSFLVEEASARVKPLIDICLKFGVSGKVPTDLLDSYEKDIFQ